MASLELENGDKYELPGYTGPRPSDETIKTLIQTGRMRKVSGGRQVTGAVPSTLRETWVSKYLPEAPNPEQVTGAVADVLSAGLGKVGAPGWVQKVPQWIIPRTRAELIAGLAGGAGASYVERLGMKGFLALLTRLGFTTAGGAAGGLSGGEGAITGAAKGVTMGFGGEILAPVFSVLGRVLGREFIFGMDTRSMGRFLRENVQKIPGVKNISDLYGTFFQHQGQNAASEAYITGMNEVADLFGDHMIHVPVPPEEIQKLLTLRGHSMDKAFGDRVPDLMPVPFTMQEAITMARQLRPLGYSANGAPKTGKTAELSREYAESLPEYIESAVKDLMEKLPKDQAKLLEPAINMKAAVDHEYAKWKVMDEVMSIPAVFEKGNFNLAAIQNYLTSAEGKPLMNRAASVFSEDEMKDFVRMIWRNKLPPAVDIAPQGASARVFASPTGHVGVSAHRLPGAGRKVGLPFPLEWGGTVPRVALGQATGGAAREMGLFPSAREAISRLERGEAVTEQELKSLGVSNSIINLLKEKYGTESEK